MSWIKEFREFAMRGNVMDLAVGVVIGTAFTKIVNSMVANIVMPPLNLLTSKAGVNFNEMAWKVPMDAPELNPDGTMKMVDGAPVMGMRDYAILNYGPFLQSIVDFLLIAVAVFVVIKMINSAKARFEKPIAAEAPKTPEDIQLLREIRDALQKR
ncbi:MAG: large conductance mechanosensitive channel protein MscL [Planctomycetaceae bacterium]|nr:large conductance mechanosensitive channel protein MscL [Planctomycetaceae bacterium]